MKILSGAVLFVIIAGMCLSAFSEENEPKAQDKVQGVDLVTDAAAAVVSKTFALLSGKLEFTMSSEEDRIKNKNKYTENVLGETIPKATVAK